MPQPMQAHWALEAVTERATGKLLPHRQKE
jgi:hypothetical protein